MMSPQKRSVPRVEAFAQLREMILWLRMPLDHPDAYG